jgi:hypothetical protein
MAAQIFDFPYHKVKTRYFKRGLSVTLGNGWDYSATPHTPAVRIFTLSFQTMKYFDTAYTTTGKEAQIDMAKLETFYQTHEQYAEFLYPHPIYGNILVKFNAPLEIPEGITGGEGALGAFSLEFKEVPVV